MFANEYRSRVRVGKESLLSRGFGRKRDPWSQRVDDPGETMPQGP
jgi:hypothetical protein